jgi:ATP-dependent DNA helicase RecG
VDIHLQSVNSSWDFYIRNDKSIEDISFEKVEQAIEMISKRNGWSSFENPLQFLQKNELIINNKISNACYLLFCKDPNLHTTIELGFFADEITIKDSITSRHDLISQVDVVLDFIKKHINKETIITESKENIQRWQYPLDAIREIVLNMVVHRDYSTSADSQIKIFKNRIVFYNPGTLPASISIEQLFSNNYVSYHRNKQIAQIDNDLGWIEKI